MKFLFLLSIILFTFNNSINAKSGKDHKADMYKVLPFAQQQKIDNLYDLINACVDYKDIKKKTVGIPDTLKRAPLDENLKLGNHRVLFHWGFNGDPRKSKVIQEKIAIYLKNEPNQKLKEIKEYAFWDRLITEQKTRNKYIIQRVCEVFGLVDGGRSGQYANAFASLLVDTHILGDYTTTHKTGLQDFNLVIADIKKAILNLAQNDTKDLTAAKILNKKLDSIKSDNGDEVIKILENNLPKYIIELNNFKFKNHFIKLGLKLK